MRNAQSAVTESGGPEQIVALARSGARPTGWFVWPLRRDRVRRLTLQAALYDLLGIVVLVPLLLTTVPVNFEGGTAISILTVILLGIPAALVFYSSWAVIGYLLRLARADQYLLVITPTDYVKAEPGRLTHVPMRCVGYITLKGERAPGTRPIGLGDLFARRPPPESRGRGPTSLAFRDTCAKRTIVVATDDSFEELVVLTEALRLYAPPDPTS
jgi:hypothetical protein